MKNEAIIAKLQNLGVNMYKQQLHKIFVNPFYCGMIAHGMLNGKVIEGKHEKMVSREVFLKVNGIIEGSTKYGVPHKMENENMPLKVFMWCVDCSQPFTGYVVKKKNLYYYKCRTNGCKCNKSVKEIHARFEELLSDTWIKPELSDPILYQLENTFINMNKGNTENEKGLKTLLTELNKKIDMLEEKYFIGGEMGKETYDKFLLRYREEQAEILKEIDKCVIGISNHREMIKKAIELCLNLATVWRKGSISIKEKLQKLLFPEGLAYDRQIGAFRTDTINSIIAVIARLTGDSAIMKKGLTAFLSGQSLSAEREGFEPPEV